MGESLKNNWVVYEHHNSSLSYEQNTNKLITFNDLEYFWRYFNNYPSPQQIFYNLKYGKNKLLHPQREISSISLFKNEVYPKWEDPHNQDGGDLAIRSFKSLEELSQIWELFSVYCVGELFQNSSHVNGIRIVDSSIPTKKELYRIELWFSDKKLKNQIETDLKTILKRHLNIERVVFFYKEHSTATETVPYRYRKYGR